MLSLIEKRNVKKASELARFFEIDIVIKVFGVIIFAWHFPPQNNEKGDNNHE